MKRSDYFHNEFIKNAHYSIEDLEADLKAEIDHYSDEKYEPGARGARIAAAIKKHKTSEMFSFLIRVVQLEEESGRELDVTPLMATEIMKKVFNRRGNQGKIVAVFGDKSTRFCRNKLNTPENREKIVKQYRSLGEKMFEDCLKNIEEVKAGYSLKVSKIRIDKIKKST